MSCILPARCYLTHELPTRDVILPAHFRTVLYLVVGLSCTKAYAGENAGLTTTSITPIDWQPLSVLPASAIDRRCRQCGGGFIDPLAGSPVSDPLSTPVVISASDTTVDTNQIEASGGVSVVQGSRLLRADKTVFNRGSGEGLATGAVTLREPGIVLKGDQASYSTVDSKVSLQGAQFVLHNNHLSGAAARLDRSDDGTITVHDGAVTFCAPDDPSWLLRANTINIEPTTGVGVARGTRFEVSGVPVFYLPWLQFPIDDRRKTGLLFPDIGSDTRGGLDLTTPIYINLAPNYDLTYAPRFIAERGLNHQINGRLLDTSGGYWDMNGAYLSQDDKYRNEYGNNSTRWLGNLLHTGSYSDRIRTTIDYTRVSDIDFIRDLDNESLSAQRQTALMQLGQIDYLGNDWAVSLQTQAFQSLAEDIQNDYQKWPQITAHWRGGANWHGIEPIALAQYSNFKADGDRITGQRGYTELGATYPLSWSWGFLRPAVKYRAVSYELDSTGILIDDNPSAGAPMASIDAGLLFERVIDLGADAMTQTLEPRLYYLYSGYTDQRANPFFDSAELTFSYDQMYRDTRFSGHDRIDDANQVTVGVTTRLFNNADGREQLNASIGHIFYFRDREVRLNTADPALTQSGSATALEFNWQPGQTWSARASVLYDAYNQNFDAASVNVIHRAKGGGVFNAGYTLREPPPSLLDRPVTEQANISAYYPIDNNWRIFGALEYSLEASEAVEDMLGVEYDNCCWQVRILYMRYLNTAGDFNANFADPNLERENALQFQFVVKGMGGFGSRVENLLNDMIRGFDDRY